MISVVHLGRIDYSTGLSLQRSMVELRHARRIDNLLLLLEHTPVITLGRSANRANILASDALLERQGVEVFETDRGGDVTYHGPGQLVGYPIFDLRSFPGPNGQPKTIGAVEYVRRLEEVLIRACADFGVAAGRVAKLTGVWTEPAAESQESHGQHESGGPHLPDVGKCGARESAKIAAIGVHISRGITSHGFAFNVNTNLDHFQLIVPCGIATKPVTSLSKETGAEVPLDRVAEAVARNFGRVFNSQVLWVDTLEALLGHQVGVPMRPPKELRSLHEDDVWRV
jgi:lipoyl(octanoyl) transferase